MSERLQLRRADRPKDTEAARELLAAWFAEYAPMVRRVAARAVRREDVGLAEDLAQDVWLAVWQYLLRGNTVERPAGLLARMALCRAADHYRQARVFREHATDFQDDSSAVTRLASRIGAAA